ncbi:MAG TPA: methionyl-tRNA formyltransferase [Candidatus Paceibacterota bacterium]|jgi:methionyl-tRNA formyltransferase|nr:methionyl-tRNA formyltransferase [Candidatus Paceibacterota bacterium]
MNPRTLNFAFFGTPAFVIPVLEKLKNAGFIPSLVVTAPDKPQGRDHILTPPAVKVWAEENGIPVEQPAKVRGNTDFFTKLKARNFDLFIVAGYGKILPQEILDLPAKGTLNVHPSLLPLHRGPAPVESQILSGDENVGVSVIALDAEMDHGPIVAQKSFPMPEPLPRAPELDELLWPEGGKLLAEVLPQWIDGSVMPKEQDHSKAAFTKKFAKEDGLIDLADNPLLNFRKFKAHDPWPGTYFFVDQHGKKIRVIVKEADLIDGQFVVRRIIPEGKKEMNYADFMRNLK